MRARVLPWLAKEALCQHAEPRAPSGRKIQVKGPQNAQARESARASQSCGVPSSHLIDQWKRSTQDEGRMLSSSWCAELRCLWTSQVLQPLKAPQIWVQHERHPRWRFRFKQWHTVDIAGRVRAWRVRGWRKEEKPAKTEARAPRISVGMLFPMVWVEKQLSLRMLAKVDVGIRASVLDRISVLTET